ncbi:uncharacterized protein LOC130655399 [Hydractinia symbiolongicarpus]|uniref:uncharacterized protein LOC130655399 n=1 Tax=Hydractinia symbiolongicarpus TaxID=13093 RepID=UPI00254A8A83|nr:uncharacterized protein LOC130655399 [Hydractinia symbiolongicarpus]
MVKYTTFTVGVVASMFLLLACVGMATFAQLSQTWWLIETNSSIIYDFGLYKICARNASKKTCYHYDEHNIGSSVNNRIQDLDLKTLTTETTAGQTVWLLSIFAIISHFLSCCLGLKITTTSLKEKPVLNFIRYQLAIILVGMICNIACVVTAYTMKEDVLDNGVKFLIKRGYLADAGNSSAGTGLKLQVASSITIIAPCVIYLILVERARRCQVIYKNKTCHTTLNSPNTLSRFL